ncbi:VCBS repeat-containing protein, partial [Synechococcus sp. AH-601-N23]|nr:VCBS repeat-containing protein [Synechococcus sp. AH-601-N23]
MSVLNLLSTALTHGEQIEALNTAMHAVDRLLLRWQSTPEPWQQLLKQAFKRSAPVDLNGIPIELLDGSTMAGLRGAYTASDPSGAERVYLNAAWLTTATAPELEAVLLEELGHAIDQRLNGNSDTPGDEGAIFSALISGVAIPSLEATQNDNHTLMINGKAIAVEAAAPVASGTPTLETVVENNTSPAGETIANLFASSFSDTDSDTLKAVAITANSSNSSTEGTWQYYTYFGSSWSSISTSDLSDATALKLSSTTKLRFLPNEDYTGSPGTLTVRLIDNSLKAEFTELVESPFGLSDSTIPSQPIPTFADIDDDGDFDLFAGDANGPTIYYQNVGSKSAPNFLRSDVLEPFGIKDMGSNAALTFADLDGDGDQDLLIGDNSGDTFYYENVGSSNSAAFEYTATNPFSLSNYEESSAPKFVDIDNDNDFDLFIGYANGETLFHENIGSSKLPDFAAASSSTISKVGIFSSPEFADIDGDGDLDAFIGEFSQKIAYLENTGSPTSPIFATLTEDSYKPFGISFEGYVPSPAIKDIDDDGDLDALIGVNDASIDKFLYFENTTLNATSLDASSNGGNTAISAETLSLSTYIRPNDAPTGLVTISGTPTQGETLTAANTLADLDGLGTISYQWNRAGAAIDKATASTYTLVQADVGSAITVIASYTDGEGKAENVSSSTTSAVANVDDPSVIAGDITGTGLEDSDPITGTLTAT